MPFVITSCYAKESSLSKRGVHTLGVESSQILFLIIYKVYAGKRVRKIVGTTKARQYDE